MLTKTKMILLATVLLSPVTALPGDLVLMIQQDLQSLGYEVGETSGELSVETAVAISRFQAENDLEVTGEPSPQLAGIVKATIKKGPMLTVATTVPQSDADLQSAQQACLENKMAKAQEKNQKKRGWSSLVKAVTRTASQYGSNDVAQISNEATYEIYSANQTASDLKSAAKDLGIKKKDIEACRSPAKTGDQP
jgi:peptidoglycan hydrolase-like protein with peptidoglycan-binding domain